MNGHHFFHTIEHSGDIMESYQQILQIIRGDLRDVGGDLQRGASDFDVERIKDRTQREFGSSLPLPYVAFLRITDGLSWGGVAIYGTSESPIVGFPDRLISGFIESNIEFRKSSKLLESYLIFGNEGDCLLSLNTVSGMYEVFTVFMTSLNKFNSFEEMILYILKKQLNIP